MILKDFPNRRCCMYIWRVFYRKSINTKCVLYIKCWKLSIKRQSNNRYTLHHKWLQEWLLFSRIILQTKYKGLKVLHKLVCVQVYIEQCIHGNGNPLNFHYLSNNNREWFLSAVNAAIVVAAAVFCGCYEKKSHILKKIYRAAE